MAALTLETQSTALVFIDLQNGILGMTTAPHAAMDVASRASQLAAAARAKGMTVVYVRVDVNDMVHLPSDAPTRDPNAPPLPAAASELAPQSGVRPGDVLITKRQWGAFHDTGLDQQLRRRGIKTIMLGGIATNFGVESTARAATDQGYAVVFVEDAMTSISAEAHAFVVKNIFPRMGRVRSVAEVLEALA